MNGFDDMSPLSGRLLTQIYKLFYYLWVSSVCRRLVWEMKCGFDTPVLVFVTVINVVRHESSLLLSSIKHFKRHVCLVNSYSKPFFQMPKL